MTDAVENERNDAPVTVVPTPAHLAANARVSPIQALYERAITDPSFDLERLERIADRLEAEKKQAREQAFYAAISEAQKKMHKVVANKRNDHTRSRYASYDALDAALRPIYTEHGFGVTFDTEVSPKGVDHMRVYADVTHRDGHIRQYKIDMPIVTKGPQGKDVMTPIHASGSAFTYGKRYLLSGIFNIAIGNDPTDDDGNAAGGAANTPITAAQVEELKKLITDSGTKLDDFLAFGKVESLEAIPVAQFASAKFMLEEKIRLKAAKKAATSEKK